MQNYLWDIVNKCYINCLKSCLFLLPTVKMENVNVTYGGIKIDFHYEVKYCIKCLPFQNFSKLVKTDTPMPEKDGNPVV